MGPNSSNHLRELNGSRWLNLPIAQTVSDGVSAEAVSTCLGDSMTSALQREAQPRPFGPDESAAECRSNSLFNGAAHRSLKANEALFLAGEPADGCYKLEQGLLKI